MRGIKRGAAVVLATFALLVAGLGTASADPDNAPGSEVFDVDCGPDGALEVLVQDNASGVATFDVAVDVRGRQFMLKEVYGRFYQGEYETEPAGEPDVLWLREWGERNGYSRTLQCEVGPLFEVTPYGTFTGFLTVTLSGK